MILKKMISIALLVSLLCSASPAVSYGSNLVCFDKQNAAELLVDITVCKENVNLLDQTVKLQQEKIDGLAKDKVILNEQKDKYKKLYIDESAARQEAVANTPSRFTWFSIGSVATGVAALLGLILVK